MNTQLLILVTGHNASGKSTLTKEILSELNINRVNGDIIRDLLISSIKFYSGTHYSYPSKKIKSVNRVVSTFRKELTKELLSQNQSVVIDGGGITKETRDNYLRLASSSDKEVVTIIIEATLAEDQLLDRLKDRDKKSSHNKWVNFYKNIRKRKYKPADNSEADFVFEYNQSNSKEIIRVLKNITSGKATSRKEAQVD